ncbi:MAG TPA: hypothetical protein VFI27_00695 [candidate division Zixibacteria bacterium]|nr:hypothetical protein [candidate division Zixibacteria bacterium]
MDQLSQKDLQLHASILGWLLIVTHAVGLVVAVFLFFLLTGIGAATGDGVAFSILSVTGTALGLFIAVLSLPGVLAGYGLLTRKSWGRLLALVVAVLGLLNFPVGTIVGLYALWVLLQQEASYYFAA